MPVGILKVGKQRIYMEVDKRALLLHRRHLQDRLKHSKLRRGYPQSDKRPSEGYIGISSFHPVPRRGLRKLRGEGYRFIPLMGEGWKELRKGDFTSYLMAGRSGKFLSGEQLHNMFGVFG